MANDIRRAVKQKLDTKQNELRSDPARLGDGAGHVAVPGRPDYCYVRVGDRPYQEIYNVRTAYQDDLPVLVGFDPLQPHLWQVLQFRGGDHYSGQSGSGSGAANTLPPHGPSHSAFGGDPTPVELRQFLPFQLYPAGGLSVRVYQGLAFAGGAYQFTPLQVADLTASVPATAGKALYVLFTIDAAGAVATTAGAEADIAALALSDIPTPPAGTAYVIGAVRLYAGQTVIEEALSTTDFLDPRFPMAHAFNTHIDAPASYTGEGGKVVAVKTDESGVEFIDPPTGGSSPPGDLGFVDPMTAVGDMIYEDTGNVATGNLAVQELGADATATSESNDVGQSGYAWCALRSNVAYDANANLFWMPDASAPGDVWTDSWLVVDLGASFTVRSWYLRQSSYYLNQFAQYEIAVGASSTGPWSTVETVDIVGEDHTKVFAAAQTSQYFRFKPTAYVGVVGAGQGLPRIYNIGLYEQTSGLTPTRLPIGDPGEILTVIAGKPAWATPSAIAPVRADYSEADVSNPPTKEQADAIFGTPGVVGAGFMGIINDNGARINQYLVVSNGFDWSGVNLTKLASTVVAALAILAGDTFTDTNGTSLASHTMDDGPGWTSVAGTWTVQSNTAQNSDNATGEKIAVADLGQADGRIHLRAKTLDTATYNYFGGVVVRYTDASNYWVVGVIPRADMVTIREVNAGVSTDRAYKTTLAGRFQKYTDIDVTVSGDTISATFDGGYGLTYTSSFNNTATQFGLLDHRDTGGSYKGWAFDDFQAAPLPTYPWTRQGDVLTAGTGEGDNVLEASVIYEGNARILSGNVFKMWYTGGWGTWSTIGIRYAESTDGLTWTKYSSNPLITHYARSSVFKDGGTYYMYASYEDTRLDLLTSSDGLAWTVDTSNVLPLGGAGAWDDQHIVNTFVWKEGASDWRLMYEGNSGGGFWHLGYATSTDGRTWTKSGSNPVLSLDGGTGGPFVKKVGDYYYLFIHKAPHNGQVPTNLYRYRSTDLVTWTPYPMAVELARIGSDQGEDNYVGQLGDPFIVEAGGTAYFFFSATSDGTQQSGNTHIEVATADPRAIYDW